MDTQNPSVFSFISPQAFNACLGRADMPLVLDVRRQERFNESVRLLACAQRCASEDVAALAASRPAGWRAHPPLTFAKRSDWGVTGEQPSRCVTRERPKIDRIACPWLIRRFIDTQAAFFYVKAAQVLSQAQALGAVAYDTSGAPVSHVGELCSFDALLLGFDLHDAALDLLATVVRGADTEHLELAPQSAGLLAFSLGLAQLHAADDHAMLEAAMPLYDALDAWCCDRVGAQDETHNWKPTTGREAT